ncbi:hypothetical protein D3C76_1609550 [compost metagenome]
MPTAAGSALVEAAQSAFDKSFIVVLATATILLLASAFIIRAVSKRKSSILEH